MSAGIKKAINKAGIANQQSSNSGKAIPFYNSDINCTRNFAGSIVNTSSIWLHSATKPRYMPTTTVSPASKKLVKTAVTRGFNLDSSSAPDADAEVLSFWPCCFTVTRPSTHSDFRWKVRLGYQIMRGRKTI